MMMSLEVSSEQLYLASPNTRYTRAIPSPATKKIGKIFKGENFRVLDFGAGSGRNSKFLFEEGFDVIAYDPFPPTIKRFDPIVNQYKKDEFFDIVLVSFVLNVLPNKYREQVISELKSLNAKLIIVEVRSALDIARSRKDTWVEFEDGFITGGSRISFQKGFTFEELFFLDLGKPNKWTKNSGSFSISFSKHNYFGTNRSFLAKYI